MQTIIQEGNSTGGWCGETKGIKRGNHENVCVVGKRKSWELKWIRKWMRGKLSHRFIYFNLIVGRSISFIFSCFSTTCNTYLSRWYWLLLYQQRHNSHIIYIYIYIYIYITIYIFHYFVTIVSFLRTILIKESLLLYHYSCSVHHCVPSLFYACAFTDYYTLSSDIYSSILTFFSTLVIVIVSSLGRPLSPPYRLYSRLVLYIDML